jgi:hypothetical protein
MPQEEKSPQNLYQNTPDFLNPYILIEDMRKQDAKLQNWLKFSSLKIFCSFSNAPISSSFSSILFDKIIFSLVSSFSCSAPLLDCFSLAFSNIFSAMASWP